jgi:general stress protein YciG
MAGTKAGGMKAAALNLAKDPDFYKKIGSRGGKNGTTGGFGNGEAGRELAKRAGKLGGTISRRGSKQNG